VHVVWVGGAVGVEVAAEEGFVFEGCGEDFACWEEVVVGGWADGHFVGLCRRVRVRLVAILLSRSDV
jgi:hypothetical protein